MEKFTMRSLNSVVCIIHPVLFREILLGAPSEGYKRKKRKSLRN